VKKLVTIALMTLSLTLPLSAFAEATRYVSDELEITMRTGKGVEYGIRKMLTSGTKLSLIETDPSGYSKVKTENGTEGWVLTRYLSNKASARNRLARSEQKVANLELQLAKAQEEIATLSSQNSTAGSENSTLKETAQRLSKELDDLHRTASNAVALDNENRQLKERIQQIDHENQSLTMENDALKNNDAKSWFLVGAAVLFGGFLLGLIIPKIRFKKKSDWGNI
jgi:SH3 domain protein